MKVVIDIPDKDYENCKMLAETIGEVLIHHSPSDRIKYFVGVGVPLPKGHGRLKDTDELYSKFLQSKEPFFDIDDVRKKIYNTPTIIEADEAESEEV